MAGEILTELNRIDGNIDAAFEKCRTLGATMPQVLNSDYLPATIESIPSASDIPVKTASDMTVSGATVTAPAGWYKSNASKSVATATQATPSISVSSGGLITASATQSAGYVAAGTKSGTKQLTTQAAKTVTPTTSEQTAVAAGVFTTGAVKVAKIPDSYIQPTGTKSITENGTHDVKAYESVEVNVPTSGGGGGAVETVELIVNVNGGMGFGYSYYCTQVEPSGAISGASGIPMNTPHPCPVLKGGAIVLVGSISSLTLPDGVSKVYGVDKVMIVQISNTYTASSVTIRINA